ncbi:DUF4249 domain-containing protein [Aquimarina addita]|uniref:DUF4249 domain-containing protein n=1 Tax=Aquimarina addita TaxID=870485 RepID=A0ABP6UQA0_9FLAO
MKKLLYILTITLLFINCEDVVEIDVPEGDPRLVIDASFQKYFDEDPITTEGGVKLSLSTPFYDEDIPPVSTATVFITNLQDNTVINFEESSEPGFYVPDTPFFEQPELNIDYELTVIYDNETYKATTQLFPTVPIDNIVQGDRTLFDGDETEIIISFTDDPLVDNFYLFDFDFNLYSAAEDRFISGDGNFSYFYDDMVAGQEITIKVLGIDKQYFEYSSQIIEQSGQDGGGPFEVPPTIARGNIINTTNSDNFAFGYFNLSEADRFSLTIVEKE